MKEVKLLHLYYDLLNMYGENGNIVALVKALEEQRIKVIVDFKSIDDDINFNDYDFIYVGTGNDEDYNLALNDLKKYKKELKKYIDSNKVLLATGNSLDLFAELNILDFKIKKIDFRIIGEQIYKTNIIDKTIIGFQNRDTVIKDNKENKLFDVIKGTGYEPNINIEGINKNNFYGTYLLGPLLIRNPYLLEYFVKLILDSKNIKYKQNNEGINYKAYEEFLKNFVN